MSKCSVFRTIAFLSFVLLASRLQAANTECSVDNPEGCGQSHRQFRGESRIGPSGGQGISGEDQEGAPRPQSGDHIIDTSDPKNWPKARYPDIDLSGELQEVDLSGYVFEDDEGQPPPRKAEAVQTVDPNQELDQEAEEMKAFGALVDRLEVVANEYACTVSGLALFLISGDDLVFKILSDTISKALTKMGQEFGAQMIRNWETDHVLSNHTCDGIVRLDQSKFDHPVTFLLEAKSLFTSWLTKRDIEPTELIDVTIPVLRSLFGKWFVTRLMVAMPTTPDGKVMFPDSLAEALIPFVKDDDKPMDTCISGAGLHAVFVKGESQASPSVLERIKQLVDVCYAAGRSSEKPAEFGKFLLSCGREKEARELFDLAVERGELCHPLQRPENVHRKDLTARAIWHESAFPELQKLPQFAATLATKLKDLHFFEPANRVEILQTGTLEIAPLYATAEGLNQTNCEALGAQLCGELKELHELILDANDAYFFGCNGTFTLEVWKLGPPAASLSDTGAANIVIHLLASVQEGDGNTLSVHVGEETALLEPNQLILFDDTFENHLELTTTRETDPQPLYVLHGQVCHPDLHEKALWMPSKKCVSQSADDVKV